MRILFSTVAPDAAETAEAFGAGLELAQFCTAYNMDACFAETNDEVMGQLRRAEAPVLHGPFNELFPCAIDPLARELAAKRYRQAMGLCRRYGSEKLVLHGGYNPRLYYPVWYTAESVKFWREFLHEDPGVTVCLENVFEETPEMLLEIVGGINDSHLRICLDVGHVNAYSAVSAEKWVTMLAPFIAHFHIHDNSGAADTHSVPGEGSMPLKQLLHLAGELCPEATFTMEVTEAEKTALWLREKGFFG